jgi:hypothetical protein
MGVGWHWQKLAARLRLDEVKLIDRIRAMAEALPNQVTTIQKQVEGQGLSHVTIKRLCKRLKTRAIACQNILKLSRSNSR